MYSVKVNVLDNKMHTLATNKVPSSIVVAGTFTANVSAYKSISIIQPKFLREGVSTETVSSVDYPNILATNVVHPQTGEPLFYCQGFPKVNASGKEVAESLSITDHNGNLVDKSKYFVVTTDVDIKVYTNLKSSDTMLYFINAIFYKNTPRPAYIHAMLNTHKALEYNADYIVTYSNGEYTLSTPLYTTSDPDRTTPIVIPYDYDATSSWRLEIPPIVMPLYTVTKSHYCTNAFTASAVKTAGGIYKINTYDAINIKDSNGYIQSFDSYGHIYAPSATDDTLQVTVVRGNYNQFVANVASDDIINLYAINGIVMQLSSSQADSNKKIATVHINRSGNITFSQSEATGGGLEDSDSDLYTVKLFNKLSNLHLRTTADRSTYDATYPVSKGITVAQLPIDYTSALQKGDAQRIIDTSNASKATGSQIIFIDTNGFQITKGYFAEGLDDLLQIQDEPVVPDPIVPQDTTDITDTTNTVIDSPYVSTLSATENVDGTFSDDHEDSVAFADSIQTTGNISTYSEITSLADTASIDKVTARIDDAQTDHDVAF